MKCQLRTCEAEATHRVTIRLPERWDETTVIAESARNQPLVVCQDHALLLEDFGIHGVVIEHKAG